MLKIHGRANSINVRKVLWMLDEVGQPYERQDWGRGYRPTSEAEFAALSRFGVVPVISDDAFVLRESHTIVRYLASKYRRTDLYPADGLIREGDVQRVIDVQTESGVLAGAPPIKATDLFSNALNKG